MPGIKSKGSVLDDVFNLSSPVMAQSSASVSQKPELYDDLLGDFGRSKEKVKDVNAKFDMPSTTANKESGIEELLPGFGNSEPTKARYGSFLVMKSTEYKS